MAGGWWTGERVLQVRGKEMHSQPFETDLVFLCTNHYLIQTLGWNSHHGKNLNHTLDTVITVHPCNRGLWVQGDCTTLDSNEYGLSSNTLASISWKLSYNDLIFILSPPPHRKQVISYWRQAIESDHHLFYIIGIHRRSRNTGLAFLFVPSFVLNHDHWKPSYHHVSRP